MKKYSEDQIIGNLKGEFVKKSLRSQIRTPLRPTVINGNISLAYYRGLAVSREETIDDIIHLLKKKFPKAALYVKKTLKNSL